MKLNFLIPHKMSFDLFSKIDFSLSNFTFLTIFVWIFSLIIIFKLFYFKNYSFFFVLNKIFSFLIYRKTNSKLKKYINISLKFSSLFKLILLRKLAGLFPYIFGWTPHILVILFFSFCLWLSLNFRFFLLDKIRFFSHLVPFQTPLILGMFLRIIELIRKLIRPLTLSLRLGIKITTGHILLSLIRIIGIQYKFNIIILILGRFYFLFEIFVMFIQAIVFTLLLSQYSEETLILKKT